MNKKGIIILLNLLISVALLSVVADSFWSSVKALRIELDKKNQEAAQIEQILAKIQELEKESQAIEGNNIQGVFSALPKEKDVPYLINQFEILASDNGLLFESLKFGSGIEREKQEQDQKRMGQVEEIISPFPYLSVEVSLSGSYESFKNYLDDLENSIRLMDVREINFKSEQEGEGNSLSGLSIFKFNLGLIVYYQ